MCECVCAYRTKFMLKIAHFVFHAIVCIQRDCACDMCVYNVIWLRSYARFNHFWQCKCTTKKGMNRICAASKPNTRAMSSFCSFLGHLAFKWIKRALSKWRFAIAKPVTNKKSVFSICFQRWKKLSPKNKDTIQ